MLQELVEKEERLLAAALAPYCADALRAGWILDTVHTQRVRGIEDDTALSGTCDGAMWLLDHAMHVRGLRGVRARWRLVR